MMMMKMIIVSARWLTYEQLEAVFPEGTIISKRHRRDYSIRRGGNRSWIAETAILSATTKPRPY